MRTTLGIGCVLLLLASLASATKYHSVLDPDQHHHFSSGTHPYSTTYTIPIIPIRSKYFPVKIITQDCVPRATARCHVRFANINVNGANIAKILRSNDIGLIWLPNILYATRVNFDLLQDDKQQSVQRCYANTWVWPYKTVVLHCLLS